MASPKTIKLLAAAFFVIALLGVILQFYTSVPSYLAKGRTLGGTLIELLTFFTIQTNILVAICFMVAATSTSDIGFLKRPGTLTAVSVYISIVALVYNLVLRQTFHPVGLARVSDEIVHVLTPALFICYWIAFVPKAGLRYKDGFPWLWYPLFYLIYALLRGAICGRYPYFFLDVIKFGYPQVILNIAILIVVFLVMDMLYVFIAKLLNRHFGR
jgi:hypothetical protein